MSLNVDPIYFPHLPIPPVLILLLFRKEEHPRSRAEFLRPGFWRSLRESVYHPILYTKFLNLILFWFVWGDCQSICFNFKRFWVR